jgi:DOPA 4,5-dioxygenase
MRYGFDAHVYFSDAARNLAYSLREKFLKKFAGRDVLVGKLVDRAVGPHPISMFEIQFNASLKDELVRWLNENRGDLSVLIHPNTEDEKRDHSESAEWLGKKLPLNLTTLKTS